MVSVEVQVDPGVREQVRQIFSGEKRLSRKVPCWTDCARKSGELSNSARSPHRAADHSVQPACHRRPRAVRLEDESRGGGALMTVAQPALAPPRITSRPSEDGGLILRSEMPLEPYEASLGLLLRRWAQDATERTFLAERGADGEWQSLTWGEANTRASAIAQALLDRGLGPDRMLMILSGNSIDHALLTLAG